MRDRLVRWSVNMLMVAISLGLVLLAFELYLVYDDRHPEADEFTSEVLLNGKTYRFIESMDALNRPETGVLIVGDSFTAGSSCADRKNYPSEFTRRAAALQSPLHAINMGVVGTGPIAYSLRARDYLTENGTAAGVILTFYANDIEVDCDACRSLELWSHLGGLTTSDRAELLKTCNSCLQSRNQKVSGNAGIGRRINWWLADNLRTYQVLREALAKLAVNAGVLDVTWGRRAFPGQWRDVNGIHFKQVKAAIELAKQETDGRSIPLMVVFYPDPTGLTNDNEYVGIYDQAASTLEGATGVPTFSGYKAFLGNARAEQNMRFSLTDTHPSCEAHAIFGEWVFDRWQHVNGNFAGRQQIQ